MIENSETVINCHKCGRDLNSSEFYSKNDKIIKPCKKCKLEYYKAWRERNQGYHKRWHMAHPDANKRYVARYRGKVRRKGNEA